MRYEGIVRENIRKEKQLRDMQQKLESGEGCKLPVPFIAVLFYPKQLSRQSSFAIQCPII